MIDPKIQRAADQLFDSPAFQEIAVPLVNAQYEFMKYLQATALVITNHPIFAGESKDVKLECGLHLVNIRLEKLRMRLEKSISEELDLNEI